MQTNDHHGPEVYELGWWPEIVGAIAVMAISWFLVYFSTGIL